MPQADLAEYLSKEERALLGQAFSALRLERGKAWNVACDRAAAQGKRRPSLESYGIDEIDAAGSPVRHSGAALDGS